MEALATTGSPIEGDIETGPRRLCSSLRVQEGNMAHRSHDACESLDYVDSSHSLEEHRLRLNRLPKE